MLFVLLETWCNLLLANTHCPAEAGVPAAPFYTHICNDGSDNEKMLLRNEIALQNSNTSLYTFIVSNDANGDIIGTSDDGIFDFSNKDNGTPYPAGEYCFTGFAYNQDEFYQMIENPYVQALNPCIEGRMAFQDFIACVRDHKGTDIVALDDLLKELNLYAAIAKVDWCYDVVEDSAKYCLQVIDCEQQNTSISHTKTPTVAPTVQLLGDQSHLLNFYTSSSRLVRIQVSDLSGRVLLKQSFASLEGNNQLNIFTAQWESGLYVINLEANQESHFMRLLVQ